MAIIPANNNTGLYNTTGAPAVTGDNITVSGNVNANNFNATSQVNAGTNITAQGNVAAGAYFIGDGSLLTNISAGNISGNVANATYATTAGHAITSNTVVDAAQPAITSVGTLTSLVVTGNITSSANISGSYILGNGSQLTGLPEQYGNANVAAYLPTYTGNLAGGNIHITDNGLFDNDLTVGGTIYGTFSGNIAGNLVVPGSNTQVLYNNDGNAGANSNFTFNSATAVMSVTGNVNATRFNGSGAGLTAIPGANVSGTVPLATYVTAAAQANITSLGTLTGLTATGNITTSANISGSYILGNGSQLTGLPALYGNSNVSAYLASGTNTANIVTTGNVTGGNLTTSGTGGNIVGANVITASTFIGNAANINGNIATTGILTNGYYYANGTPVTFGGGSTYGDSNVATFMAAFGSNTISSTGNITTTANISGGNLITGANAVVGGVKTDNYYYANGTPISFSGSYGNANVAAYLPTYSGNIGEYGNISSSLTLSGDKLLLDSSNAGPLVNGILLRTPANGSRISLFSENTSFNSPGGSSVDANVTIAGTLALTGGNAVMTAVGNITGGNLITGGKVVATGNISGGNASITGNIAVGGILTNGYYYANGTPVTFGGGGTYGDSNVTTLLASLGSNVISSTANITTTANVQGAYVIGNGSALSSITGANVTGTVANATYATSAGSATTATDAAHATVADTANAVAGANVTGTVGLAQFVTGNAQGNITSVGTLTGLTTTGTITVGAVTYANTDGTNGQFLTTYGNGITYWSTGGGGGGSPGGSNTQIQFNDGGSFAGNAAITFNKTSGNIGLGNLIVNTQQIQTTQAANVAVNTSLTPNPGRVYLGTGYAGNTSAAYDVNNTGRASRFLVADSYNVSDSNSVLRGIGTQNWFTLTGNVTGANVRLGGISGQLIVGGGAGANTIQATVPFATAGGAFAVTVGGGTSGNLTGLGNTIVSHSQGVNGTISVNAGSTAGNAMAGYNQVSNNGTANTIMGFGFSLQGGGTFTNAYGVYMPGGTNNHGFSNSNNARNSNFWFLKNEDDHSYTDVGQLTQYQETQYALTSSGGAVTVNKTNGQVQFFTVSEDATMDFSNFVVSSTVGATTRYMTDTVTVIVQQDGTGRTITMPSGSAYKYAAGGNNVPTTASSVSMISITGYYDSGAAATAYLITISPEFS